MLAEATPHRPFNPGGTLTPQTQAKFHDRRTLTAPETTALLTGLANDFDGTVAAFLNTDDKPQTRANLRTQAADLITRQGWTQDWYWDDAGDDVPPHQSPLNVVGAINVAAGLPPDADRPGAARTAMVELARILGLDPAADPGDVLVEWNDAEGRTVGEVIAALRATTGEQEAGL